MTDRKAAIGAIRTCETRETLDKELARYDINGTQETIDFLNECMYNPQTFFSSEQITLEDKLEFTKQMFLTGTWRLNAYYEKIGMGGAVSASV